MCVYADMYDGLCLLQKKIKDLGRCKDMLFLDTDSFHTRVCEHKYFVFLFEYSQTIRANFKGFMITVSLTKFWELWC